MHSNNEVKAMVKNLNFKYDVNSLTREGVDTVSVNDIINVTLRTNKPLITDKYAENRTTGALILVDENTNETVAAGMIC
jgi:sulfate adenylyltransferase subunit 1